MFETFDYIIPIHGVNIFNIITLILFTIIIIAIVRKLMEGGKMFGKHVHKWRYMYSSDAAWDWFFCEDCLTECCQTVNVNTGVVERHAFAPAKKGK